VEESFDVVCVGDPTFRCAPLASRTLAGIVEMPDEGRRTRDRLADQVMWFPSTLVLAHDLVALERCAAGLPTPAVAAAQP
jgi:hypothetical protein